MRSQIQIGLLVVASAAGCVGEIGDPDGQANGDGTARPPDAASVPVSGMRRLTLDEYDSTLRDLLGDDSRPAEQLLPEDPRDPFDNDYSGQVASQALIEGADLLAANVVTRLLAEPARLAKLLGCTPTGAGDASCMRSFVATFGRRALRRKLDPAEVDRFVSATLPYSVEVGDFNAGVDAVVRALLEDPRFLYRIEIGTPVGAGVFRLDDWEIASRLSYFLWGSMPDDWLLDQAEAGALGTPDAIRAAAEHLLDDPRARARVDRFHALWLGFEVLPEDPDLASAMRTETNALLERVIFEDKRPWQDIFRLDETFVSDTLAKHYGLTPPGSSAPVWTSYGASGRKGLLSHGTFLSNGAKLNDTSPTRRGLAVRTRLFCQTIPPPPPNVNVDDAVPATATSVCKVDRYAAHAQGGCASCHGLMDPVGFGLENYDQFGRYRTVEADHPECTILGKGELKGIGAFHGPAELEDRMLAAHLVDGCVIQNVYRFAAGRTDLDEADLAVVQKLADAMGQGDFRFEDVLLELVSSNAFAYRREETVK